MSNYVENKKKIEEIRNDVGEPMFRMAISHLMDVGIRNLDEENVRLACNEINKEDDSRSFMTNRFECYIVETAAKLAQISHVDLLVYIQREVDYDVFDNALSYKRAIELLYMALKYIEFDKRELQLILQALEEIGVKKEEFCELGFDYLIDEEEV